MPSYKINTIKDEHKWRKCADADIIFFEGKKLDSISEEHKSTFKAYTAAQINAMTRGASQAAWEPLLEICDLKKQTMWNFQNHLWAIRGMLLSSKKKKKKKKKRDAPEAKDPESGSGGSSDSDDEEEKEEEDPVAANIKLRKEVAQLRKAAAQANSKSKKKRKREEEESEESTLHLFRYS